MNPFLQKNILLVACLLIATSLLSQKIYTTYLWHMDQPVYWAEKSVNKPETKQFAEESHRLKMTGGNRYPGSAVAHPTNNLEEIFFEGRPCKCIPEIAPRCSEQYPQFGRCRCSTEYFSRFTRKPAIARSQKSMGIFSGMDESLQRSYWVENIRRFPASRCGELHLGPCIIASGECADTQKTNSGASIYQLQILRKHLQRLLACRSCFFGTYHSNLGRMRHRMVGNSQQQTRPYTIRLCASI